MELEIQRINKMLKRFVAWPKPPEFAKVESMKDIEPYDKFTLSAIRRAWKETYPRLRYVEHRAINSIAKEIGAI